jgi:hypothetical protein
VELVLEFANWMITAATGGGATHDVVMPQIHRFKSGKDFVIYKPDGKAVVSVVPRPVLQKPCARLARVWNLEVVGKSSEESVDSSGKAEARTEASLRGKTVFFGDVCCEKDFEDEAGGWYSVRGSITPTEA